MSSCEIELAREPNTKQKHAHKAQRVSYVREGSRRFLLSQSKPPAACENDSHDAKRINADKAFASGHQRHCVDQRADTPNMRVPFVSLEKPKHKPPQGVVSINHTGCHVGFQLDRSWRKSEMATIRSGGLLPETDSRAIPVVKWIRLA